MEVALVVKFSEEMEEAASVEMEAALVAKSSEGKEVVASAASS